MYLPLHFLIGLVAALALNDIRKGRKIVRLLILLPWTLSLVSIALSWKWMLHRHFGLLNSILKAIGLKFLAQDWLSSSTFALPSLIAVNTWYRYPFVMLVLLAGLQTVPDDLLSAARVDGANKLQSFIHVVVPWMRTIMGLTLVLSFIYTIQAFTTVWIMTGGGPAGSSELFSTYIYRRAFVAMDLPEAAAVAVILFVVATVAIVPYVYLSTRKYA
jgi:multiple sugar transport system permease protein